MNEEQIDQMFPESYGVENQEDRLTIVDAL